MQQTMVKIKKARRRKPEASPVLEMLYNAYTRQHPLENDAMRRNFQKLEGYLSPLPKEVQNGIYLTVCDMYTENERLAFQKGVLLGAKLSRELEK